LVIEVMPSTEDTVPTALVIAHPGHELRVYRWVELTRPCVYVLTDGSGHGGAPRIDGCAELLAQVGATRGPIFGRFSDRALYAALLDQRWELFVALAEELADALAQQSCELVVGDAIEGFNPGHDVTRLLINAAVSKLRSTGARIDNREFPLDASPAATSLGRPGDDLRIDLDESALERKLEAAHRYPGLADETAYALARYTPTAFQTEWLRPVTYGLELDGLLAEPPHYEQHGARQVAAGFYREILRYRSHVRPLAARLQGLTVPALAQ
jgi:hypothetical protein